MLKGFYVAPAGATTIPGTSPNLIHIDRFGIREIDGIGRPEAELYTTELVGTDASAYSSQTVKSRTITLSVDAQDEYNMCTLYKQFPYNTKRRLIFETEYDTYFIDGIAKGMPRTQGISNRAEFEIPIFCPYPWFRSLRAHEVSAPYGTSFSARQAGDIRAGIVAYAEMAAGGKLRTFELSDNVGNAVSYRSSIYYLHVGTKGYVRLVDTTPGAHGFITTKAIQDITLTNDWVTVPPDEEGITITATFNTSETPNGKFVWYDTWGGI